MKKHTHTKLDNAPLERKKSEGRKKRKLKNLER